VPKSQHVHAVGRFDFAITQAPEDAWERHSCVAGAKGPRVYDRSSCCCGFVVAVVRWPVTGEVTGSSGGAAAVGPCARIPAEHMAFIRQVLDRVGDKWSLLLIAVVESGPLRYTDLQRQVPGISQRMLTLTLHQLREDGLITRTAYAEVPPRVEYSLTPLGRGLLLALSAAACTPPPAL